MIFHDVIPHHHEQNDFHFFEQILSHHDHEHAHGIDHSHHHEKDHPDTENEHEHPFHEHLIGADDYLLARNSLGDKPVSNDHSFIIAQFAKNDEPGFIPTERIVNFKYLFFKRPSSDWNFSLRAPPVNS